MIRAYLAIVCMTENMRWANRHDRLKRQHIAKARGKNWRAVK